MVVLGWLVEESARGVGLSEHARLRYQTCKSLHEGWLVLKGCKENFFTEIEARRFFNANKKALLSYRLLADSAMSKRKARWPVKPKHHLLEHIAMKALRTRRSPSANLCFSDESFVGQIKWIGQACHSTTVSLRALQRHLIYHRLSSLNHTPHKRKHQVGRARAHATLGCQQHRKRRRQQRQQQQQPTRRGKSSRREKKTRKEETERRRGKSS